ncbi:MULTISPECIES: helix-turn-helix transcriptional regulator [unclassified Ruegeria]|uniref:helix-turn-helix domain-containing protein n=1 Tax=unclassified Ruegeria TaxID=2625375 RepID=UPI001ADBA03F|nr:MULTISPECIES: helix-turn-helix transcriptional regulator [unclassified Ruegeria]
MNQARYDVGLGKRFLEVRKKHNLSQQEFAISVGVSRSAYQSYERAEREVPFTVVRNISEKYDIDIRWLAHEDGAERMLMSSQSTGARYDKIFRFIDARLVKLDRVIEPDKRLTLAMQLEAQLYTADSGDSTIDLQSNPMFNSLIVSMSEAA